MKAILKNLTPRLLAWQNWWRQAGVLYILLASFAVGYVKASADAVVESSGTYVMISSKGIPVTNFKAEFKAVGACIYFVDFKSSEETGEGGEWKACGSVGCEDDRYALRETANAGPLYRQVGARNHRVRSCPSKIFQGYIDYRRLCELAPYYGRNFHTINEDISAFGDFKRALCGVGRQRCSLSSLLCERQALTHVTGLKPHGDKLQQSEQDERTSEPRNPIAHRFFIMIATAVIAFFLGLWGFGQIDRGRRLLGWLTCGLSLLSLAAVLLLWFLNGFSWTWGWYL